MIDGQAVLDGLNGVAYIINADGDILLIGRSNWQQFARDNECYTIESPEALIGSCIFDWISGEKAIGIYHDLINRLIVGDESEISFSYRCDAPGLMRRMLMHMTILDVGAQLPLILFQSQVLEQHSRAPVKLFTFNDVIERLDGIPDLGDDPLISMCSFCQRVRDSSDHGHPEWIETDEYYRRGGVSRVAISHGVCGDCYETLKGERRR